MATNAGSVYVSLGGKLDRSEFAAYDRELEKVRAKTARKEQFKAQLGGDFDARAFNQYERASAKAERQTASLSAQNNKLGRESKIASRSVAELGGALRELFKESALITAGGIAVQGISALGGAGVAATASLGPLVGLLGSLPALATTGGQAMGVFKLATSNVFEAVGGLNEELDKQSKAFKKLDPQAQKLAEHLDSMKGPLRDLQKDAQKGFFPGFDKGITSASKNLPILDKIVKDTSKTLGGLVAQAGQLVGSKGFGKDLATQGRRNTEWIGQLGKAGITLVDGLRHITLAAGELTGHLVDLAVKGADTFQKFAEENRKNGNLQDFFKETADVLDRVLRITRDLGLGLINIFRGAYPLGKDFQVSLEKTAAAFRHWTESTHGKNEIAHYFDQIRPAAYELFKLIRDVGKAFLHLGGGEAVAPLIRTIRTELLPVLVHVVENTTAAFGPAFLDFLVQAIKLFSTIAGTSGPLVAFTTILGSILTQFNNLIDKFPILGSALATLVALGGISRVLGIAAGLKGMSQLIGLMKVARGLAVSEAVVGAVGGLVGARGGVGAAAGGLKGGGAAAAGAKATNIGSAAAGGAAAGSVIPGFGTLAGAAAAALAVGAIGAKAGHAGKQLKDAAGYVRDLIKAGDPQAMKEEADRLEYMATHAGDAADGFKELQGRLRSTAAALEKHRDTVKSVNDDVGQSFKTMKVVTNGNLGDIRRFTAANTREIKERLGEDTRDGKNALARNYKLAAQAVKDRMEDTGHYTRAGTREIHRLMAKAFVSLGLNEDKAINLATHGSLQSPAERVPGAGGGQRAAGGWIGRRGDAGGDDVPAMLGKGEAVLNRHQQAVVEGYLGDGFLDELFAKVDRPHYLARGGRVRRMASGGIAGAISAATAMDRAKFPYHWGGGHESTIVPFEPVDCSGAVSYVLQHAGVDIPSMVSGDLARHGKPGPGALTVFANPVHTFMRIGNRYFGTSGSNPGGGAGFFPDPGSGYKSRFTVRHYGAGDGLGATIKAPRIGGSGSVVALGNRALQVTTAGANQKIKDAVASMGLGGGDAGDPGPTAHGSYSKARLASLWRAAGGPSNKANLAAAIAMAESRGDPNAKNVNSNGSVDRGLWQINSVHGARSTFDPEANAAAAVAIWRDGGGFGPWSTYNSGAYSKFLSRGGRILYAARGINSRDPADRARRRRAAQMKSAVKAERLPPGVSQLKWAKGWGVDYRGGKPWDIYRPGSAFGSWTTKTEGNLGLAALKAEIDTPDDLQDDIRVASKLEKMYKDIFDSRRFTRAPQDKIKAAGEQYLQAHQNVVSLFTSIAQSGQDADPVLRLLTGEERAVYDAYTRELALDQVNAGVVTGDTYDDNTALAKIFRGVLNRVKGSAPTDVIQSLTGSLSNYESGSTRPVDPNLQAILDQASTRSANAEASAKSARQIQQAFGSSGDIGYGGFGNAYQAAGNAPRITINTLHPADPATLTAIAQASNSGNSLAPNVSASRTSIGV